MRDKQSVNKLPNLGKSFYGNREIDTTSDINGSTVFLDVDNIPELTLKDLAVVFLIHQWIWLNV